MLSFVVPVLFTFYIPAVVKADWEMGISHSALTTAVPTWVYKPEAANRV
jgi:hypothetical protein